MKPAMRAIIATNWTKLRINTDLVSCGRSFIIMSSTQLSYSP